ncbi:hypothetical protein HK097_001686 [Rhizophlyctis rosea]|uniref:Uncharacterized protein n=1 Tax=Rhizophlyctis rosea TaxID=64517 RepID=A0AAD5X1Q5_9FUNG|nr:hypothetical protein HK097_001686 [Rhizophlyctis rosea]
MSNPTTPAVTYVGFHPISPNPFTTLPTTLPRPGFLTSANDPFNPTIHLPSTPFDFRRLRAKNPNLSPH